MAKESVGTRHAEIEFVTKADTSLRSGLLNGVSNTGDGLEIKWIVPDDS